MDGVGVRDSGPCDDQPAPPGDDPTEAAGSGLPTWITPELIQRTIEVWQPYYETRLSPDDARTILTSVSRLFGVLYRD